MTVVSSSVDGKETRIFDQASVDIGPVYQSFQLTKHEQNKIGLLPAWKNQGAVLPDRLEGEENTHSIVAEGESVPEGIHITLRHQMNPLENVSTKSVEFSRKSPGKHGENRIRLYRRQKGRGAIESIAEVRVMTSSGRVSLGVVRDQLGYEPRITRNGGKELMTEEAISELSDVLNLRETTVRQLIRQTSECNFSPDQLEKRIRTMVFDGKL